MHEASLDAQLEAIRTDAVRQIVAADRDEAKISAALEQAITRAVGLQLHRQDAADTAHFGPPD
jgi:hypothetical protein